MTRSGSGISAIFARTSPSPSAWPARPRRAAAFSSRLCSFIAARSSSVHPTDDVSLAVVPFAGFCVSVIAGVLHFGSLRIVLEDELQPPPFRHHATPLLNSQPPRIPLRIFRAFDHTTDSAATPSFHLA